MNSSNHLQVLTHYKQWADNLTFQAVSEIPESEALKVRPTRFGNMVHTLNHVYVIDDIFKAHLLGIPHQYISRNTESHPPLQELWELQKTMDRWYLDYVGNNSQDSLFQNIDFEFVGGGQGSMTRSDMVIHVVNHSTYHRGFIGDLMYQASSMLPANDYPVFLREVINKK